MVVERAPALHTRGVAAGLHVVLKVEDEEQLVTSAAQRSLALQASPSAGATSSRTTASTASRR